MAANSDRRVRLPYLLVAFAFLVTGLFGFAVWDFIQHKRAVAEVARHFGGILWISFLFVVVFIPEIWFTPLLAWLEKRAPGWLYYTVVWCLAALAILGLALIARTAFVYVWEFFS